MTVRALEAAILATLASMGLLRGCGADDPPPVAEAPMDPAEAKAVDDLLSRWEEHASEIRSVEAEFTREEVSKLFDTKKSYRGQYLAKGSAQAYVSFAEIESNGKVRMDEELILDAGKLQ